MAIPVSRIVRVTISTSPQAPTLAGFSTLLILGQSTTITLAERYRTYTGPTAVDNDLGSSSEEAKAARAWFGQTPRPERVVIARQFLTSQAGQRISNITNENNPAVWAAITDGSFVIPIDGTDVTVTGADFSGDVTMTDVAASLSAALTAAQSGVTAQWTGSAFVITSDTTGVNSSVGEAKTHNVGTDITAMLALDETSRGVNGIDAESRTDALAAADRVISDWYGLVLTKEDRDVTADIQAVAQWIEARVRFFGMDTENPNTLVSKDTSHTAYALKQMALNRTFMIYNFQRGQYAAASALGRMLTVNFGGEDTTITLNLKQLPGVTAGDIDDGTMDVLQENNVNAFVNIGTTLGLLDGRVANARWADEVHGLDWLQNLLETNVFGSIQGAVTKLPNTPEGRQTPRQRVELGLQQAVNNGLAAPGFTDDGEFLPRGFVTSITDPSPVERQNRHGGTINFTLIGAGAIHGMAVSGVFER